MWWMIRSIVDWLMSILNADQVIHWSVCFLQTYHNAFLMRAGEKKSMEWRKGSDPSTERPGLVLRWGELKRWKVQNWRNFERDQIIQSIFHLFFFGGLLAGGLGANRKKKGEGCVSVAVECNPGQSAILCFVTQVKLVIWTSFHPTVHQNVLYY